MLKRLIKQQASLSRSFDRLMPHDMRIHGQHIYNDELIPSVLHAGLRVADVGSGRYPVIDVERKQQLGLHVIGIDLEAGELAAAPAGAYDEAIPADITTYRGNGDVDLIVCRAVLEHVKDTQAAFKAMASILKPGGRIALFVPSRNAAFARLNLMLPNKVTKQLLKLKAEPALGDGWPSYYNRCTPADFQEMAANAGLDTVRIMPSYISNYFTVFAPVFVLWRMWMLGFRAVKREQAAETFCAEFVKQPT